MYGFDVFLLDINHEFLQFTVLHKFRDLGVELFSIFINQEFRLSNL